MADWLKANYGNIIIMILIAGLAALCIRSLINDHRAGRHCGGCKGCSGCSLATGCQKAVRNIR